MAKKPTEPTGEQAPNIDYEKVARCLCERLRGDGAHEDARRIEVVYNAEALLNNLNLAAVCESTCETCKETLQMPDAFDPREQMQDYQEAYGKRIECVNRAIDEAGTLRALLPADAPVPRDITFNSDCVKLANAARELVAYVRALYNGMTFQSVLDAVFDPDQEKFEIERLYAITRPTQPPPDSSEESKERGRRGRPQYYDSKEDRQLSEQWELAREEGKSKEDFAGTKGITVHDLNKAIDRHRQHEKRQSHSE